MNCRSCQNQYSDNRQSLPRVLINCGHTLCESCIQKTFGDRQITCPQCGQISFGMNFNQYPINATLIALIRQQAVCKIHSQKLQAYCQKDNELLCLSCVIGSQHKNHKISSVSQKVTKDKTILKQCMKQIEDNYRQIQNVIKTTRQAKQRLEGEYKDYLLEIGLCFNTIRENIKQIQENWINKAKIQYESILQKYDKIIYQVHQRRDFITELTRIYEQLIYLPNLQYLHQDNKRLFIVQNCRLKKPKVETNKLTFNKINVFSDVVNCLQTMIGYQRKLIGQLEASTVGANNSGLNNLTLKNKKSNRSKQPTILQVNLNEQYRKHYKSIIQSSSAVNNGANNNGLSNSEHVSNSNIVINNNNLASSCNNKGNGLKNKTRNQKSSRASNGRSTSNNNIHDRPTTNTNNNTEQINAKTPRQNKQNTKKQPVLISAVSAFGNSNTNSNSNSASNSNSNNNHDDRYNNSFHSQSLHLSMIHSFMESSTNRTLSMKGSEADFTIVSYEQKVFHFGSFNDSSIQFVKVQEGKNSKIVPNTNIERSKAQCAVVPSYNEHKCLIFGGKSLCDQKLDTFVQYDFFTNRVNPTPFKLSEPKSGFGSVVKQNKLYVVGGSNNQRSLKSVQQYKIYPSSIVKSDMVSMNHCRDQLGLTLGFDGHIYACGGINQSGSVLSSCQRYNQSKARWEIIASMNKPRRSFTLVSLPHGIYAIGGYDGSEYLKQVQLYDFTLQKWINITPMNQPRFAHTAIVTLDLQHIIVNGGFHKKPLKSTQVFDIINEKWTQGHPLQAQRFLHCSLVVNI